MKVFTHNKMALKALALIFIFALVLGLCAPFSALEIPEEASNETEESQNLDVAASYVVFDAEYIRDNIPATNQGDVAYVDETPSFVQFTPAYEKPIDPYLTFKPTEAYSADVYKYVSVVIRAEMEQKTSDFWLYFVAGRTGNFTRDENVKRGYSKTNGWQVVTFDLSTNAFWTGEINKLRLDVCNTEHPGTFDVAAIIFSETPQAVYDGAFTALADAFASKQVISDFTAGEENYFSANATSDMVIHNTKVSVKNGNILLEGTDELNDPYAGFMYQELMEARGVDEADRLTTADFNSAVIRFRADNVGDATTMELFHFTGENKVPFQITLPDTDELIFASTSKTYLPAGNNRWQCVPFALNNYEEAWQGDFNGFRIDWCSASKTGGYMEISDIVFFENLEAATEFSAVLNTVALPLSVEPSSERPFLVPLEKDSGCMVLTPDEINGKIIDSSSAAHVLSGVDGKQTVRLSAIEKTDRAFVELNVSGIDVNNHRYLSILVKRKSKTFENFIVYSKSGDGEYYASSTTAASYENLDGWQVLTFLFDEGAFDGGDIDTLKLNFSGMASANVGDGCEIGGIAFSNSGEAAYEAAYYLLSQFYVPVQILTDFKSSDVSYFNVQNSGTVTNVSAADGSLVYSSTKSGGDPGKMFSYTRYAEANELTPVTTLDFRYTVVRYRSQGIASNSAAMELFILTGDAKNLFDMASIYDVDPNTGATIKLECRHCARGKYQPSTQQAWRSVMLDMAVGDGYETSTHLKNGWYREDGNYTFKGFRMDWCLSVTTESVLQISDFIFFQDQDEATAMNAALNAVNVPVAVVVPPDEDEDFPFDDVTDTESESESETATETETREELTVESEFESDTREELTVESESENDTVPEFIESGDDVSETVEEIPTFTETEEEIPEFTETSELPTDSATESGATEEEPSQDASQETTEGTHTETFESSVESSTEDTATESGSVESSTSESENSESGTVEGVVVESSSEAHSDSVESEEEESSESGGSEDESQTESEEETEGEDDGSDREPENGGEIGGTETYPIGGANEEEKEEVKPSKLPFYLACVALILLSIASVVSVLVIKCRNARLEALEKGQIEDKEQDENKQE